MILVLDRDRDGQFDEFIRREASGGLSYADGRLKDVSREPDAICSARMT